MDEYPMLWHTDPVRRGETDQRRAHRTTIDIDLEAFEGARRVLGTRGYRETVNEALREVDRRDRLQRAAAAVRAGGLNLITPEDLEELRKARR
jgi:Arc/MetJ family transcription regulator